MYSVIVVDDEPWICRLIKKIVDWNALGFNIVANAGDGITALKLIEKHKPDLVITDIRMPGLDGLDLIKTVRGKKLETEFVIISGYSDFEYARHALTYEAFAYILKPLDKDEFEEVLYRIKDRISKKYKLNNKIKGIDITLLEMDLRKIIDKINKDISIEKLNDSYKTNFAEGSFYAVAFKQDFCTNERDCEDYQRFLSEIRNEYSDAFQEVVYLNAESKDQAIFVINTKSKDEDINEIFTKIIQSFNEREFSSNFTLTISIGKRVESIDKLDVSYEYAVKAMKARVLLGTGKVIDAEKEAGRIVDLKNVIDIRQIKKLSVLLDILDMENAMNEIREIFSSVEKKTDDNLISYHIAAYEIIDLIFAAMKNKGISHKNGLSRQQAVNFIDQLGSIKGIENYIAQLIKEFQDSYVDERQDNGEKLITEIKRFISENYMKNINLDDVARLVCLSPTYVSEIFKRKTDVNFSEYLIDYRIEVAQNLLKDLRYKVTDVSLMVGYTDSKYFSRLFKKKVGIIPTDYRKLFL